MQIPMIRPFLPSDASSCFALLASEGLREEEMRFQEGITGVLDEGGVRGMFTLELADGIPSLKHFCVSREYRDGKAALQLIRGVRSIVRQAGFAQMIVHAKRERLNRMIRWYFKARPYAWADGGVALYLVGV